MSARVRQCYEAELVADGCDLTDEELTALSAAGVGAYGLPHGWVLLTSLVSTSEASARRRVRRAMLDAVPDLDLSRLYVGQV